MKIDIIKTLLAGAKYTLVAILGVLIAMLGAAITGYVPTSPTEIVIAKYIGVPVIIGIIGLLRNLIKHLK